MKPKMILIIALVLGLIYIAVKVGYDISSVETGEDKLTAFIGFWLSNLSIASLLIQLLITGRVLKCFGVTISLFFLPFGILIGTVCILFNPALWSAILVKVSDGGFKQSINKAGFELLSLPLPSEIKNQG